MPSCCFSVLEEAWEVWHPLSLLQSRTGTEDHCPGRTIRLPLQRCSSDSLYCWLFHYIRLSHAAASVPCPITVSCCSVEVVNPGTDRRRWKPTWEPGSEKQRTSTLPWLWNTATLFQKLYSVVSRTFFDPKLSKSSLFSCLKSWKEMSNPRIQWKSMIQSFIPNHHHGSWCFILSGRKVVEFEVLTIQEKKRGHFQL